jgi:hypothetical protein
MIEDGRKGTKPLYEPPKVMKLDGSDAAIGSCWETGSGAEDTCGSGNSATGYCAKTGSAATGNCEFFGISASGVCYDGNSGGS